ncbi:hypothetical protein CspeluHIS016_0901310 [Cutaneotrichosporon spelunceum]|uniref:Rpr2-domain-containing protein n=1 Tax=Cutaneotrichosporon spelunceum TaxID=1672016 RepID=A0AAD3U0C3_9TREE|nr:hypothetical protein CspeluHIS016_0901310 [Cutaneotrichosporon spelunceum]
MVRKQNGPALPNRDHLERAHFTLQASVFLQELASSASSSSSPDPKGKGRAKADFARLAQTNMRSFRRWTVHNLVKLDPSVKHALCACNTVLVPGLSARVRVRPSAAHGNVVHTTCGCGHRVGVPAAPCGPSAGPSAGEETLAEGSLDGPVRAARRARLARKVPFHRRERADVDEELEDDKPKGKKKGKAQAGPVKEGHVLWAGSERVSGWGVLCDEPHGHDRQLGGADVSRREAPVQMQPEAHTTQPEQKRQQKKQQKQVKCQKEGKQKHDKALTPEELEELANNG